MRYLVKFEYTEEGYTVWCPGLPGCWSQGDTQAEALENIKDAIQCYLETIEELAKDIQSLALVIFDMKRKNKLATFLITFASLRLCER